MHETLPGPSAAIFSGPGMSGKSREGVEVPLQLSLCLSVGWHAGVTRSLCCLMHFAFYKTAEGLDGNSTSDRRPVGRRAFYQRYAYCQGKPAS